MYHYQMYYSVVHGSMSQCKSEPLCYLTARPSAEDLEKKRLAAMESLEATFPLATYIHVAIPVEVEEPTLLQFQAI